jgi:hypothetical protein
MVRGSDMIAAEVEEVIDLAFSKRSYLTITGYIGKEPFRGRQRHHHFRMAGRRWYATVFTRDGQTILDKKQLLLFSLKVRTSRWLIMIQSRHWLTRSLRIHGMC